MSVQTLPQTKSREIVSYDPATGKEIGRAPLCSAQEVQRAVERARAAQPTWATRSFRQRAHVILKARELMLNEREEIAQLVSSETGKPAIEALSMEVVPTLDASNQPIFSEPIFVDSLERYRRTLFFSDPDFGLTPEQIRARGGGASQFSISSGNPLATVKQFDAGLYAQDDWRVRPNLTFSFGLRYENQTNISSLANFAPRLAMAWSPGAANSTRPPNMVIRAGGGIFYNRFSENNTLQANRLMVRTSSSFLWVSGQSIRT